MLFVAQAGLALGSAGCELIDWEEVVDGVTRPGPRPTEPSACAAILCPVNTTCVVKDVACVRAPCPPVAECVPIRPEPAPGPCAAVRCPGGTVCEERPVACVKEPCPPVAQCVPVRDPPPPTSCAAVLCIQGTHCEERQVACVRAPCPPIAECVPN